MELTFANARSQKLFNSAAQLRSKFGPRRAQIIQQRLSELSDVETLEEMRGLTGARCHELTGRFQGHLAVDAMHPFRLVFRPTADPPPAKPDGGLDWGQVQSVEIVGVVDYH